MHENEVEQLKKNLEKKVLHDRSPKESVTEEMKSLNDRYAFLLEALKTNLTSRKPILEKLKCSFVVRALFTWPEINSNIKMNYALNMKLGPIY